MTNFQKVRELIAKYQKDADRYYANYKAKEEAARKKYSSEGFQQEFMQQTWVKMTGQAWADADEAIKKVMEVFDDIEKDLSDWMMHPLDESTTQILNCIGNFSLKLSLNELQIIEKSLRDSYFGLKIFSGLCEGNGYHIDAPSMKQFQDALKAARSNASLAVRAYAGSPDEKYPGRDLLQRWESKGVVLGEYEPFHLFYAYNYLQNGELDRLEQMWGVARAPMRYSLTSDEAEKVRQGVKSFLHDGEIDKKAAQALIKREPAFKDKLTSMPNEFFADKEALIGYFGLDKKEESFESGIDSTTKNAPEYGTKFSKIDPQTLANFS